MDTTVVGEDEKHDSDVVQNTQVILKWFIDGTPKSTDMEVRVQEGLHLRAPRGSSSILVKNLYLSCDPYMRGRMRDYNGSYIHPFVPGSVIEGLGVSKVVDSDNPEFVAGDLVSGVTGWEEYTLLQNTTQLRKIERSDDIPLSYHLGLLGMPGFTAYVGFYEVCKPKPGEHVFVSAASGAVGQIVGQLAKIHGCYVVGSAGTDHKVNLLKNRFGFDEAFNYKDEPDLEAALKREFPKGIDIYFDNVGGEMLDAALVNMRLFGRIAVCGIVSQQGLLDPEGVHNLYCVLIRRLKVQGFLQGDYLHLYPRFLADVSSFYNNGKVVYVEDVRHGLESAPDALVGIFTGRNVGKQVICVAAD